MDEKQRKKILAVLFVGVLMGALDVAIIGPAMPSIRQQLGLSERQGAWIFSIYIFFNLISTPLMARLSDLWGRRWTYVLSVSLFGLGSLMAGISPAFGWLLFGRAMQGAGAGGVVPVAGTVIGDTFPPEKRGGALGLIGAVFGIAFLLGPFISGPVVKYFGWRWLFFVNLPIAIGLIYFSLRLLPNNRTAKPPILTGAGWLCWEACWPAWQSGSIRSIKMIWPAHWPTPMLRSSWFQRQCCWQFWCGSNGAQRRPCCRPACSTGGNWCWPTPFLPGPASVK
jgi:MFS family permease